MRRPFTGTGMHHHRRLLFDALPSLHEDLLTIRIVYHPNIILWDTFIHDYVPAMGYITVTLKVPFQERLPEYLVIKQR